MVLKLNWVGIHVSDFAACLRFYTEVMGMNATDTKPDWAYFDTTGMTFELFGGGKSPADRSGWGQGQPVRPGIQVADLQGTVAEMRVRGVHFSGEIQHAKFGEWIEFTASENMRWTLAHVPAHPFSTGLHKAHIGWVELKVDRFAEQQAFYGEILGSQPEEVQMGRVVLRQGLGEPLLFLESGGERCVPFEINRGELQPKPSHLLSIETDDIESAATWLKSHNIPILIGVTRKDWGGIDLYIADPDDNPIQVVQYVAH